MSAQTFIDEVNSEYEVLHRDFEQQVSFASSATRSSFLPMSAKACAHEVSVPARALSSGGLRWPSPATTPLPS